MAIHLHPQKVYYCVQYRLLRSSQWALDFILYVVQFLATQYIVIIQGGGYFIPNGHESSSAAVDIHLITAG